MNQHFIPVEGQPGVYIDPNTFTLRDEGGGRLVQMDLGVADVHVQTALNNFATGFKQAQYVADIVAPIVPVTKQSDKYYEFSPDNELAAPDQTKVAQGANVPEVNPQLSTTAYSCAPYALAGFLPLETLGNQDAILNLQMKTVRMVMQKLLLLRELRVKTMAYTSGSYTSTHIITCNSSTKWNGGSSSDPVRNIRQIIEASLLPITGMVMSRDTWHAFTENAAVQKYVAFKSAAAPLPQKDSYDQWAALLDMPKPYVCDARAKDSTGAYPYIWYGNVHLFHQDPTSPTDGYSTATSKTFRWIGADAEAQKYDAGGVPGMAPPSGFTVRALFNPYRGPRGGYYIVVAHNDAEQFITDKVSGLIVGAVQ